MRLPTYSELIDEQLAVLETLPTEDLFVAGPPGSGKTTLAVQRAKSITDVEAPVVTFNRMLRRLLALLGTANASTMHSFVHHRYSAVFGTAPPSLPPRSFDFAWTDILSKLEALGTDSNHVHGAHVIVDEGQDLPAEFFRFVRLTCTGPLTVFADDDQAITRRHSTLEQIADAGALPKPILLRANHRNTKSIADIAAIFHEGRLPVPELQRETALGERPTLITATGIVEASKRIANWFRTRGGSVGVVVNSNGTGETLERLLRDELPDGAVLRRYASDLKNEATIDVLEPGLTILNIRSSKGQEFDTVFLVELNDLLPCHTQRSKRQMYMLCSRARDDLHFLEWRPISAQVRAALPENLVSHE